MGRPTFKIDQKILRSLRKGKTQLEIAKELHKSLGKEYSNITTSDQSLISTYQRIERTGQTSRKKAEALAEIFKVSVRVLQGLELPEPLEYLKKIVNLLNEQVQKGENEALKHEFKSYENSSDSTDKAIETLAKDIGARIEASQLSRNPSEIAELKALTGLSETELLDPANVLGHWLIIVSSACNRTEIVQGETRLINLITELLDDYLASSPSDSSIRMFQDMPWCRMEIKRAEFSPRLMRIDFTRCHPFEDKGIRWGTTWKDQYILRDLQNWANSIANFVTSFDSKQAPSQLHRLRLIVTGKGLDEVDGEMKVITGHLDEIPEELMTAYQQEGQSHYLVQNWLISDLQTFILPYLQRYPAECWMIHRTGDNSINIVLIPGSVQTLPSSDMSFYGHKYRIQLVEENVENKFDPVPWRIENMDELIKKIENWIVSSSE